MTDKKSTVVSQAEPVQEVERIRDIIFGHQMRDYEQRFQTFQRDLDRLQQEINRLTNELADQDSNQSKKLQTLRQETRQANDTLRDELRETTRTMTSDYVERMALAELFTELGTRLKTGGSVADLLKGLEEQVE